MRRALLPAADPLRDFTAGFRSGELARALAERIARAAVGLPPLRFMEVCGSHTMSAARYGVKDLLPGNVRLLSGPGCPVCVTPAAYLDHAMALALRPGILVATFGDMVRVPGSRDSLETLQGRGARVRIVYSPAECLDVAALLPQQEVVFLGIGFETTAPLTASLLVRARERGLANLSVLVGHKTMPQAMRALAAAPELRIDGFLCPAHVSTVIGTRVYEFLAREHGKPCVVAGFEPIDILEGIALLVEQVRNGVARVDNAYRRVARPDGNPAALRLLGRVFAPVDAEWRGLGVIPGSGLALAPEFQDFDAARRFPVTLPESRPYPGCRCGDVMRGALEPAECAVFGTACHPDHPLGPCMVSQEGACAAAFRYRSA